MFLEDTNQYSTVTHRSCMGPIGTYNPYADIMPQIDHIVMSQDWMRSVQHNQVHDDDILNRSDHLPVTVYILYDAPRVPISTRKIYKWKNADTNLYQDNLSNAILRYKLCGDGELQSAVDVDPYYDKLVECLTWTSEQCIPKTEYRSHIKPFWSPELKVLHVEQKRLRYIWKREGRPRGYEHASYYAYKQAKRAFAKQYKKDGLIYERDQLHQAAKSMEVDSKMFWKYIRNKKHHQDNYHMIAEGNDTYTLPEEQAGMWYKHFETLLNEGPHEAGLYDDDWKEYIEDEIRTIIHESKSDECPEGVDMSPFTCEELLLKLESLPNGKAPGHDMLTYEHIKHGGNDLVKCIVRLFNAIVKYIRIPSGFKLGLLIPIYKGGRKSRSNKNSYRGITLLPVMNKLFERCIYDRITDKLQQINIPSALQFASKKGSNCLLTSYCVQEIIQSTIEKHGKVFSAFLDLEKCFDKIWWDGLLYKLHRMGITNNLWLLFRDWLMNSSCIVLNNGVYSDKLQITRSIRQGGVLSMLMMAFAFCDIHSYIDPGLDLGIAHGDTYLGTPAYADDIVLMSNTKNGLQTMLDNAYQYSRMWRVTFSGEKSKCIVFGETKYANAQNIGKRTFILNNHVLEEVQHITHVGVQLCAYRTTSDRTQAVCNKAHGVVASLTTAGVKPNGLNPIVMNSLWNKCGISALLYGSEVWEELTKTEEIKLEKAQIRKLKLLQGLPMRTHDYVVRALVKQPTMTSIMDMRKLNFLHKLINCAPGITKMIFCESLYSGIFNGGQGYIQDIADILRKYNLQQYLRRYAQGGEFPPKTCWKAIVRDQVMDYERTKCIEILKERNDVDRFLRIMGQNLFRKAYPLYTAALRGDTGHDLIKLAKLACLPTLNTTEQCTMCDKDYVDITEHVVMYCTGLTDIRNNMWDDMVNILEVEDFVELWNKPDEDILDILLGGYWNPLRHRQTRIDFLTIMNKYSVKFFKTVKRNMAWLR